MTKARDFAMMVGRSEAINPTRVALLDGNTITVTDSASVSSIIGNVGTAVYDSLGALPVSGLTAGQQAFVSANDRLYISNGNGWYNVASVNATPILTISPSGSVTLAIDGSTPTVITLTGTDSDNADANLIYSVESDGSFSNIATLSQDSSVFTITPLAEGSATPGSSTLTFKASDGISFGSGTTQFSLTFGPDWTSSPTESIVRASDAANSDFFGVSVSMSANGNYAIAGADRNDDVTTDTGSAYIYTRSGSTWTQQAKITAGDKVANDYFGRAVSISGDGTYAVIGKPRISGTGQAYIFVRSGSTWTQQQKLTQNSGDNFGGSVSISSDGNYAAIGASIADGNQRGAVYIYSRSGSTWTMQQKLTSSDLVDWDRFGHSVSINSDGTYVVATAYADDDVATDSGSAYIFTRSGSTWTQQAKLTASDASGAVEMGGSQINTPGSSASINSDGTYAIIGAFKKWVSGVQWVGAAYIYTRSGSTWTQQSKITPSDQTTKLFGQSVSINSDATYAIIGAYGDTSSAGAAYVFSRSGSTWTQERKITASDAQANDWFGVGVSLSSDAKYAIVGSVYEDGGSGDPIGNSGAAYIYEA